ncbi:hypothetical protein [Nonomuraea sp. NPDC005650]|uniref:hypothetical protein n=1 Tax=Nonomuraea sp. NPDC005650 TaxID=3157045 RepID=UPI0033A206C5
MPGGPARMLNPYSKNPGLAWDPLTFKHSAAASCGAADLRVAGRVAAVGGDGQHLVGAELQHGPAASSSTGRRRAPRR